ncbi:DUF2807 domain-containing protein [bacterium]|nr:DUF2807 domain-containing protein [bacterium]
MKNKVLIPLMLLVVLSLSITACRIPIVNVISGSGTMASESRDIHGFDAIRLDGAGTLKITQGETESLTIEAENNILPKLKSNVQGDTLVLGHQDNFWRNALIPTREITYTLTVIDLTALTFNGAGNLDMGDLETSSLKVEINGAGQVKIDELMADSLTVRISGTGNVEIGGEVSEQTIIIDGAGNVKAGDLQTARTSVTFNGVANATVWATESLDVSINGGGSLSYYGSPNLNQDINGAGNINNMGEK